MAAPTIERGEVEQVAADRAVCAMRSRSLLGRALDAAPRRSDGPVPAGSGGEHGVPAPPSRTTRSSSAAHQCAGIASLPSSPTRAGLRDPRASATASPVAASRSTSTAISSATGGVCSSSDSTTAVTGPSTGTTTATCPAARQEPARSGTKGWAA